MLHLKSSRKLSCLGDESSPKELLPQLKKSVEPRSLDHHATTFIES